MVRVVPRRFESWAGRALLKLAKNKAVKDAKLEPKSIFLPKARIPMYYLEREPNNNKNNDSSSSSSSLTILLCHGMSDESINLAAFIHSLNIPPNVRILVPDAIGHGRDLQRAIEQPKSFQLPTPIDLLESTIEFLDVLNVHNCNAFGYSMGGALVYYMRYKRPDIINKTVLICPSLESVIDDRFVDDFLSGRKRHFCFTNRQDVKLLLRDCCPPKRKKEDPIPKFFLQAMLDERKRTAPPQHFDDMLSLMLQEKKERQQQQKQRQEENDDDDDDGVVEQQYKFLNTTIDIDTISPRLVFLADHDFICSYRKSYQFFNNSQDTEVVTLNDCGHVFDIDGTFLLEKVKDKIHTFLIDC